MPTALLAQTPAPKSYARVISFSQAKVMTLKAPNFNTLDNSDLDDGPAPSILGTAPIPLAEFASERSFPPQSQCYAVPSPLFDSSNESNSMPDPNLSKLRWGPLPIFLWNVVPGLLVQLPNLSRCWQLFSNQCQLLRWWLWLQLNVRSKYVSLTSRSNITTPVFTVRAVSLSTKTPSPCSGGWAFFIQLHFS